MMKINWKVRFKNKVFWVSIIPALLVLIQVVAALFGFELNLSELGNKLIAVVNAVFVVLSLLGIVTDHTTEGVSDSELALSYSVPKKTKGE